MSKFEISDDADELNQEIDDTNFPSRSNSICFGAANGNGSTGSLNNSYGPFANRRRSSSIRRTESEMTEDGEPSGLASVAPVTGTDGGTSVGGAGGGESPANNNNYTNGRSNVENGENGATGGQSNGSITAIGGLNRARPTPIRTTSLSGETSGTNNNNNHNNNQEPTNTNIGTPPLQTPSRTTMTPGIIEAGTIPLMRRRFHLRHRVCVRVCLYVDSLHASILCCTNVGAHGCR